MKNIYGYIRVSTKKQGDGVSLEVQKRDILYFAQNKGLNIVGWFEEQKSASKGFRPQFNEMIERLYNKEAQGFIAHKIDRMMRNRNDWAIINELIDEGCEVLSADGTTLDDVNGRFMGDIQAAVATRYSSNLAQETKKGLYGRLAQGIFPFRAPIGYLDNGKAKVKTHDEIQAPLIQQLFELYVNKGFSVLMLVDEMYVRGLRNKNGNKVTKNGIITILRNSFYTGIISIQNQQFKGNHESLISVKTFQKAQDILNGKTNARIHKHDFLFRKMITCKECGYKLIGELQKGEVYYRCHTKECPTKSINQITAENYIKKLLGTISISESELNVMKNKLMIVGDDWQENQKHLIRSLNLKRGSLNSRKERLTSLLIDGAIDSETYQTERGKILMELQLLEEQNTSVSSEDLSYLESIAEYLELAKTPILLYEMMNIEEKREYLKKVTSNLYLEGKKLMFSMLSPFKELASRCFFSECDPTQVIPRNMESYLVSIDQISSTVEPLPLSKANCERFVHYLVDNHINH